MADTSSKSEAAKRKQPAEDAGAGGDAFAAVTRGEARIGEVLAQRRAAKGLALSTAATYLRIREHHLAAIENSDFERLPGPTYALGFVRSYATFLDLDGAEAVALFKGEREGDAQKASLSFPEPVSESGIPHGAVLFIAAVLAILAYGGWYYLSSQDKSIADLVPLPPGMTGAGGAGTATSAPPPTATPQGAPVGAADKTASPPAPQATAPAPAAPAAMSAPATQDTVSAPPAPSAVSAPPAPSAVSAPPAPASTAAAPALVAAPATAPPSGARQQAALGGRIEIKAKADSWVQIRGPNGRVVVMRIFRAGDSFIVPDEKGLTLMTGNAGAIDVTVDGQPVPALGPPGAVRRDVALDPDQLKAGTAAR